MTTAGQSLSVLAFRGTHLEVRLVPVQPVGHGGRVSAIVEVRTYRAKPSMRAPLLQLLRTRTFPLQRKLGMKILGPSPCQDDDVTSVWLRGFPDEGNGAPLKAAFYEGPDWLGWLEAQILPMLDDYTAVVVDDAADLWSQWPTETP
jgi:hypothetical protein